MEDKCVLGFQSGESVPQTGEIRYGFSNADPTTHHYVGIRPYLVISNNIFNKTSGMTSVVPFTTKHVNVKNPVHVKFKAGDLPGITRDSILAVEAQDTLPNENLSEPLGNINDDGWEKVLNAFIIQWPFLNYISST